MNALFLATRYLAYHWARSVVLAIVAALILAVPLVTQTILARSQDALTDRADATPMLIGNRGSQLDLTMNALYFSDDRAEPITMAASEEIWDGGLALPIPLHTAFQSNGARIVGTSLDYFDFRALAFDEGRIFAVLGEAVLGAQVADRLGLSAGDKIVSSPENLFDLDGVYPLEMKIVGVLAPSGSPDDEAVFVDVKTAWVIAGIGHGHEDVVTRAEVDAGNVNANAALVEFNRITEDNIDSFHFHGSPESYPISAVLVAPYDARSGTILRGRYLDADLPLQAVVPSEVIGDLVDRIFRIKTLLDAVAAIVGAAALAAIALSLFLTWRMRAPETATAFRLGASRGVIARLAVAEITILLLCAVCLATVIVMLVQSRSEMLTAWLLTLGT